MTKLLRLFFYEISSTIFKVRSNFRSKEVIKIQILPFPTLFDKSAHDSDSETRRATASRKSAFGSSLNTLSLGCPQISRKINGLVSSKFRKSGKVIGKDHAAYQSIRIVGLNIYVCILYFHHSSLSLSKCITEKLMVTFMTCSDLEDIRRDHRSQFSDSVCQFYL